VTQLEHDTNLLSGLFTIAPAMLWSMKMSSDRQKPRPIAPNIAGHSRFDSGGGLKISPLIT